MLIETIVKIGVLTVVCIIGVAYNYVIAFRPETFDRRHHPADHIFKREFRLQSYRIGGCLGLLFTLVFFAFLIREIMFLLTIL